MSSMRNGDRMRHTNQCRILRHTDAAKRVADEYNLHVCAGGSSAVGRWVAFALADGSSDHVLYDSKRDAVIHQHHNEQTMMFLQVRPQSLPVCDAEQLLNMHRRMYDAGVRLTDPEHRQGGLGVIPRLAMEDQRRQIKSIESGGRVAPSNLTFGRPS